MSTPGYIRVIMRWREKGERMGFPPPALPAMYGKPAVVFDLHDKATRAGLPATEWDEHVATMKANWDEGYLRDRFPAGEYTD